MTPHELRCSMGVYPLWVRYATVWVRSAKSWPMVYPFQTPVRVLPVPVPYINLESRPASMARDASSWIFQGTIVPLLSKKIIRQALKMYACWLAEREFMKSTGGLRSKGIHSETAVWRVSSGVSRIDCTIAWIWGSNGSFLGLIWRVFMEVEAMEHNVESHDAT